MANRSIESSKLVAEKYEIKNIYNDWMELVEDPEIDAVCIGTWPYMHSIMTTTALEFDNMFYVKLEWRQMLLRHVKCFMHPSQNQV